MLLIFFGKTPYRYGFESLIRRKVNPTCAQATRPLTVVLGPVLFTVKDSVSLDGEVVIGTAYIVKWAGVVVCCKGRCIYHQTVGSICRPK